MISKQLALLNSSDEYAEYIRDIEHKSRMQKISKPEWPTTNASAKKIETTDAGDAYRDVYVILPSTVAVIAGLATRNFELFGYSVVLALTICGVTSIIFHRYKIHILGLLHTRVIRRKYYRKLKNKETLENRLAAEKYSAENSEWLRVSEENEREIAEVLTAYNSRNPEDKLAFNNSRFAVETVAIPDFRVMSIASGLRDDTLQI